MDYPIIDVVFSSMNFSGVHLECGKSVAKTKEEVEFIVSVLPIGERSSKLVYLWDLGYDSPFPGTSTTLSHRFQQHGRYCIGY